MSIFNRLNIQIPELIIYNKEYELEIEKNKTKMKQMNIYQN